LTARGRGLALVALTACTSVATAHAEAPSTAPEANPSPGVSIAGKRSAKVSYGRPVRVSGMAPGGGGRVVKLHYAPNGGAFAEVASTTTAADGSYRFRPTARRSGAYRAVSDGVASSTQKRVTVVGSLKARTTRHALAGGVVRARGRLLPAVRGRTIKLQLRRGRGWRTVDTTRTGRGGRFSAAWRPSGPGRHRLRVRFAGDRVAAAAGERVRANIYRAGHASWYGPGLYGNSLGCGGTLRPSTLGVAHKTLPCGTRVTFRHRGRSVTARVVDRGPYISGREWDLTEALKRKLGFGSTGTVWTTR